MVNSFFTVSMIALNKQQLLFGKFIKLPCILFLLY